MYGGEFGDAAELLAAAQAGIKATPFHSTDIMRPLQKGSLLPTALFAPERCYSLHFIHHSDA